MRDRLPQDRGGAPRRRRRRGALGIALVLAIAVAALVWLYWPSAAGIEVEEPTPEALAELAPRGEYVFRLAGCKGCHTQKEDGPLLAGGRALETPFGTFYPPNITPDAETGIGAWRAADLVRALREGRAPNGRAYFPAFPYPSYAAMTLEDMLALYAYLRTVPAVTRESEPHELPWYLRGGPAARAWQRLWFDPPEPIAQDDEIGRGRYIATALGHCGECHTPRDRFGVPIAALHFAGTPDGPDGDPVPNITPDREHGIGSWSARQLRRFFESGMNPDGDFVGGAMVEVIDEGLTHLTREDADALIAYLRSLPPIASPDAPSPTSQ